MATQKRIIQKIIRKRISKFGGLNTEIKDTKSLKDGVSPDELNWYTTEEQDAIILRRGSRILGQTDRGSGMVTGLGVGKKFNGDEVPFFTYGKKIAYYDIDTDNTYESGSDALPNAQNGQYSYVKPYQNLAGSFIYITSPFMSAIKIAVPNPANPVDQANQDYRGYVSFHQSRALMHQKNDIRNKRDLTSFYLSYIDKSLPSDYTAVTKEDLGNGDGVTKNFLGASLAQISGNRTACFVRVAGAVDAGTTITGISKATLAVVNVASHSLVAGDAVIIFGAVGMTEINSLIGYVVTANVTDITIDINSTSFTTWSGSGKIYKAEILSDDKNGIMESPEGGTGTINYATGAYNVTFKTAPTNSTDIIGEYSYESSTSTGVLDFSISYSSGVRVPASGDSMRQFAGSGKLNLALPFSNLFFCGHEKNLWQVAIPSDDSATGRTNLPYREQVGIPSIFGGFTGTKGAYFVDFHDKNSKPLIKRLEVFTGGAAATNTVVPKIISDAIDLTGYNFDNAVVFEWGAYVLVACAQIRNGAVDSFNSRVFLYNTMSGTWDLLDYPVTQFAEFMGSLIAGDPFTNNIVTLFNGFDDDDVLYQNYWTSKWDDLDFQGQKRVRRFTMDGFIQPTQKIRVYFAFDEGSFVPFFDIDGNGKYVNKTQKVSVGSKVLGYSPVGGGEIVFASPFWIEFKVNTGRFQYIRVKFEAIGDGKGGGGGYAQINYYEYTDIRIKKNKAMAIRRSA